MSRFPDFSSYGYRVDSELGHNRVGGRVAYLATDTRTQQPVVIKQFQFARFSSNWSEYNAYEREIQVLQGLSHSGIPCYLDAFETADGFCMVQEYKKAVSLAVPRSFTPEAIKQIAVSILEILVYLQERVPPVIHRDIKPENVLVDEAIRVYLIDFGFARIGDGEVAMSSVATGTLGFMPPEQLYSRQLTPASDLYGVGATLICLLTGTKSIDIGNFIDESNRIEFRHLLPKLSLQWLDWLQTMVEPNLSRRYANAAAALEALRPLSVYQSPEVEFSLASLKFTALQPSQRLAQTVTVNNLVPGTRLEGTWEVAPHASDPPHTPEGHAWITLEPARFEGNRTECKVSVETRQLMAARIYCRQLLLHTNAYPATHRLDLEVQTAPLHLSYRPLYLGLALLGGAATGVSWLAAASWLAVQAWGSAIAISVLLGCLLGIQKRPVHMTSQKTLPWLAALLVNLTVFGPGALVVLGVLLGAAAPVGFRVTGPLALLGAGFSSLVGAAVVGGVGAILSAALLPAQLYFRAGCAVLLGALALGVTLRSVSTQAQKRGFSRVAAAAIPVLGLGCGVSLGISLLGGGLNPLALSALVGTGVPLAALVAQAPLRRAQQLAQQRQAEQSLIRP